MQSFPAAGWSPELEAFYSFFHVKGLIWVFFFAYLAVSVWYHLWVIRAENRDEEEVAQKVRGQPGGSR